MIHLMLRVGEKLQRCEDMRNAASERAARLGIYSSWRDWVWLFCLDVSETYSNFPIIRTPLVWTIPMVSYNIYIYICI